METQAVNTLIYAHFIIICKKWLTHFFVKGLPEPTCFHMSISWSMNTYNEPQSIYKWQLSWAHVDNKTLT